MAGDRPFRPVDATLWDPALRVAQMDRHGVDLQILCATPVMFGYAYPAGRGGLGRAHGDLALEHCAHAPDRLKALAQVPLQDLDLACREASRARAAGHLGADRQPCRPARPGRRHAGELPGALRRRGIPVLVHPWDMMTDGRMKRWMLPWLVAMPAETQLGILSLILSGAFERIPRSLKLCFAHGGGSFAFLLGRVDNAWRHRDIVRQDCPGCLRHTPTASMSTAPCSIRVRCALIDVMGEDRVLLGSDYPYPLGEQEVGRLVSTPTCCPPQQKILSSNTQTFFRTGPLTSRRQP